MLQTDSINIDGNNILNLEGSESIQPDAKTKSEKQVEGGIIIKRKERRREGEKEREREEIKQVNFSTSEMDVAGTKQQITRKKISKINKQRVTEKKTREREREKGDNKAKERERERRRRGGRGGRRGCCS